MHAIHTKYAGAWFRSRLEARWAAFFDICRWPWSHEPIDLHGYIPDFIVTVQQRSVLVEVKALLWDGTPDDVARLVKAQDKIRASGWTQPTLIVGAQVSASRLGMLSTKGTSWTPVSRSTFAPGYYGDLLHDFREAGNRVQWMPTRETPFVTSVAVAVHARCYCGQPARHRVEGAATSLCDRCFRDIDDEWLAQTD
jgi:hypothetical protein